MRTLSFLVVLFMSTFAHGALDKVQARLFYGSLNADPSDFNSAVTTLGLQPFDKPTKFGLEGTYPVLSFLDLGGRFEKVSAKNAAVSSATGSYNSTYSQDVLQAVARIPIVKSSFFKFDVFGAYGFGNTFVDIKNATDSASLKQRLSSTSAFGTSGAIGYRGYYLFVEFAQTMSKANALERTGNLDPGISTLDLSGTSIVAGFMIDTVMTKSSGGK